MDKVYCQCMTIIILLLLLNVALVIGVFLKWQTAVIQCKGGPHGRSYIQDDEIRSFTNNNTNTTEDYPFVVGIVVKEHYDFSKELHCGGVIVTKYWVVTAGHCVCLLEDFPLHKISVTGAGKSWSAELYHEVEFIIHHENFENSTYNADIGLVKVKEPFHQNFGKIFIAAAAYSYKTNKSVTAMGWKSNYFGEIYRAHYALSSVRINLFDQEYCKRLYKHVNEEVTESMFCAGSYKGEKPGCHFDSGGPLLDGKILIGVVSWGTSCGRVDQPSVYTRISLYKNWIMETMQNNP